MQANDLREFADKLDVAAFKALSNGIGFGTARERLASQKPAAAPASRVAPSFSPPAPPAGPAPRRAATPNRRAASAKPAKPVKHGRTAALGLEKRLVAWALDFFFVALTLGILLCLVTVLAAVRAGNTEDVFSLAPIQWLMGVNPLELVAGVYGLFFAYVLLFKTVAGVTLGESLLRARLARAP